MWCLFERVGDRCVCRACGLAVPTLKPQAPSLKPCDIVCECPKSAEGLRIALADAAAELTEKDRDGLLSVPLAEALRRLAVCGGRGPADGETPAPNPQPPAPCPQLTTLGCNRGSVCQRWSLWISRLSCGACPKWEER